MQYEEASARRATRISELEKEIKEFQAQDYVGVQRRAAQAEELADKLTMDMEIAQQTLHAKSEELVAALSSVEDTKSELGSVSEKLQTVEVENASLKVKCATILECNSRTEKAEEQKAQLEVFILCFSHIGLCLGDLKMICLSVYNKRGKWWSFEQKYLGLVKQLRK